MYKLETFYPGTTVQMIVDWANEKNATIVQIIPRGYVPETGATYMDLIYTDAENKEM